MQQAGFTPARFFTAKHFGLVTLTSSQATTACMRLLLPEKQVNSKKSISLGYLVA